MPDYDPRARMTVRELIKKLSEEDLDALVVVNGYEGGYQAPEVQRRILIKARWGSHCGPWNDAAAEDTDTTIDQAVIVSRGPE